MLHRWDTRLLPALAAAICVVLGAWVFAAALLTGAPALTVVGNEPPRRDMFRSASILEGVNEALAQAETDMRNQQPAAARDALGRAQDGIRRLLALTPSDGSLWALLAEVELRRNGVSQRVIDTIGCDTFPFPSW